MPYLGSPIIGCRAILSALPWSGVGIKFNPADSTQSYFMGHNEDILCFGMHPNRSLCATGQGDPKGAETPFVCVWDSSDMLLKAKLYFHVRGVCAVAFSPDGSQLASVGLDDDHTVALWEWRKGLGQPSVSTPSLHSPSGKDAVLGVTFNSEGELITYGDKVLRFWSITKEGNLTNKASKFGLENSPKAPTSLSPPPLALRPPHTAFRPPHESVSPPHTLSSTLCEEIPVLHPLRAALRCAGSLLCASTARCRVCHRSRQWLCVPDGQAGRCPAEDRDK